jgi:hypothetical protein
VNVDADSEDAAKAAETSACAWSPWPILTTAGWLPSLCILVPSALGRCMAGIVVLSPAFFVKRWTAYELDGLVQLHAGATEQVAGSEQASRIIPSSTTLTP